MEKKDAGEEGGGVEWDRKSAMILFLGTCSGIPTKHRNMSSMALYVPDVREPELQQQNGGGACVWMIDCGGGTQQQLIKSNIWIGHIHRLFITHMHGDHCYDTVGLLALRSMRKIKSPFQLVGPKGIREWVETTMRISQLYLCYPLEIVELDGDEEFTILGPDPNHDLSRGWTVKACPIAHRVPCYGYVFEERQPEGAFDANKALRTFNVPSSQLKNLAQRRNVTLEDGTVVTPAQCASDRRPTPRKLVILGDTNDPSRIASLAQNCDVVVHESTFQSGEEEKAIQCGHSTPLLAVNHAASFRARHLILTHFSARYCETHAEVTVDDLLAAAKRHIAEKNADIQVDAAHDFWSFKVQPHPTPRKE
jgi:ribonuclease Z